MKHYRQGVAKALNKEIDFDTDALVWTLHTSTYVPNQDTHQYVSDLSNELSTAGGYTVGGLAISSPVRTYTAANSWATTWAGTTQYAVGAVVRPSAGNGFLYRCIVAGTSGGSAPSFSTTLGASTTDNTVTWETVGSGIVTFTCANPNWTNASFGPCRYAVLSDRTPGTAATQPLLGYVDFVTDKTGGGGNFTVNLSSTLGVLHYFIP